MLPIDCFFRPITHFVPLWLEVKYPISNCSIKLVWGKYQRTIWRIEWIRRLFIRTVFLSPEESVHQAIVCCFPWGLLEIHFIHIPWKLLTLCQWTRSTLVHMIACRLFGATPLSEQNTFFYPRKCAWIYRLRKGGQFVLWPLLLTWFNFNPSMDK